MQKKKIKEEVAIEIDKFEFMRSMRDFVQAGNNLLNIWRAIPSDGEFGIAMRKVTFPAGISFDEYMAEMKKIYLLMAEEFGYA